MLKVAFSIFLDFINVSPIRKHRTPDLAISSKLERFLKPLSETISLSLGIFG